MELSGHWNCRDAKRKLVNAKMHDQPCAVESRVFLDLGVHINNLQMKITTDVNKGWSVGLAHNLGKKLSTMCGFSNVNLNSFVLQSS